MIKRIELINFMAHERTVIEPSDGLTVLVGPNNCGKSAFVLALQILCYNTKSNFVLRHGQKKCQIIVETDDGHVVQWSRTKSGSPKYTVDGQTFDRLKQGVPDCVHEALGLRRVACDKDQFDVHFGEQKSPIFLLNSSGKAAAQFFASSSDAIRLVEMQDRHKRKTRDAQRDQARLQQDKNRIVASLESLENVESIEQRLEQCEKQYDELCQAVVQLRSAEKLTSQLESIQHQLDQRQLIAARLSAVPTPPTIEDTVPLERLIGQIESTTMTLKTSARIASTLQKLPSVPTLEPVQQLEESVNLLQQGLTSMGQLNQKSSVMADLLPPPELADEAPLVRLIDSTTTQHQNFNRLDKQLTEISRQVSQAKEDIAQWASANPACPICGGQTDVENLISRGHQHG